MAKRTRAYPRFRPSMAHWRASAKQKYGGTARFAKRAARTVGRRALGVGQIAWGNVMRSHAWPARRGSLGELMGIEGRAMVRRGFANVRGAGKYGGKGAFAGKGRGWRRFLKQRGR